MNKNSKGPNLYKMDDKYYIKDIKSIEVKKRVNNVYYIHCIIRMKGDNYYTYIKDNNYIENQYKTDILYLENNAIEKINNEINVFESLLKELDNGKYRYKTISINYKEKENNIYDYRVEQYDDDFNKEYYVFQNEKYLNFIKLGNSIIELARIKNDRKVELGIKVLNKEETIEECIELKNILGINILPKASIEHNKNYVISNIDSDISEILDYSGYKILHRPYFSMRGSTHSKWTLNPYTKEGVDAAPKDAEAISFEEFMNIFK